MKESTAIVPTTWVRMNVPYVWDGGRCGCDVYVVEHDAKELGVVRSPEHLAMRQARSRPLMDRLHAWLLEREGLHPPKGLTGAAVR